MEFIKNKIIKEPFDLKLSITQKILNLALSYPFNMTIYLNIGYIDGIYGDHIILMPSYIIIKEDIEYIIIIIFNIIYTFFSKYLIKIEKRNLYL